MLKLLIFELTSSRAAEDLALDFLAWPSVSATSSSAGSTIVLSVEFCSGDPAVHDRLRRAVASVDARAIERFSFDVSADSLT